MDKKGCEVGQRLGRDRFFGLKGCESDHRNIIKSTCVHHFQLTTSKLVGIKWGNWIDNLKLISADFVYEYFCRRNSKLKNKVIIRNSL